MLKKKPIIPIQIKLPLIKYIKKYPIFYELSIGFLSSIFLLFSTWRYGLGYTTDSVYYIEVSKNLWNGNGFYYDNGDPYVYYGPLYSMILSLSNLFFTNTFDFSIFLNVIIYGILIGVIVRWMRKYLKQITVITIGCLILFSSRPLFIMASMIWSELFFIFASLIFFLNISKYMYKPVKNRKNFGIAISAVMFACLIRYIGITLIFTGVFLILYRARTLKRKIFDSLIFSSLSSIPTGFYVFRNFWLTGTFVGERYPSNWPIWYITVRIIRGIGELFIPEYFPKILIFSLSFLLILCLFYIWIAIWKSTKDNKNLRYLLITCMSFIFIYTIYILVSQFTVAFSAIGIRYLSPLYIPIIITLMIFIITIFEKKNNKYPFKMKLFNFPYTNMEIIKFVLILFSTWMLVSIGYVSINIINQSPGGFASPEWKDSDTIKYVLNNKIEGKFYSNVPDAFFKTSLYRKVHEVPIKTFEGSDFSPDDLPLFNRTLNLRGSLVIIWFNIINVFLYDIDELKLMYEFQEIAILDDGGVYRVSLQIS